MVTKLYLLILKQKHMTLFATDTEVGGGSIRIFQTPVQKAMFRALGMSEQETQARFGFFNEALQYGTPPHGGFCLGYGSTSNATCKYRCH